MFFKHLKYNFKFQHTGTKDKINLAVLSEIYFSELIIFYLARIIEAHNDRFKKYKDKSTHTYKIDKAKLVRGIFNVLLWKILKRNKQINKRLVISKFCGIYVTYIKNKKDRSYYKYIVYLILHLPSGITFKGGALRSVEIFQNNH